MIFVPRYPFKKSLHETGLDPDLCSILSCIAPFLQEIINLWSFVTTQVPAG